MDWQSFWRDFQQQPILSSVLGIYYNFMDIKRHEHFPFYIYPGVKSWISFEDTIITFLDWMVDAHEQERNTADRNRSFYQRSTYVYKNWFRYYNDTIANLMFDTQLRKVDYDRINAEVSQANTTYYLSMSAFHTLSFMYLSYFFRFRRVRLAPAFAISWAYYFYFTQTNQIAYKWLVDRRVINLTRKLGHEKHIQPLGQFKNRGINYF